METKHVTLNAARIAAGATFWDEIHTIILHGTVTAGGLSGPYQQVLELATGRFVASYQLGGVKISKGFDGAQAWQCGATGEVTLQNSDAALRAARTEAYLLGRGYFFTERWPAMLEHVHGMPETIDGKQLRVTPDAGDPIVLSFDAVTNLLAYSTQNIFGKEMFKRFSDYRCVAGVQLAFRIESGSGIGRTDMAIQMDHVEINIGIDARAFAPPIEQFKDFEFLLNARQAHVRVAVFNNHIFVPVTINGQAMRFMLDTGAVALITPAAALRAGLHGDGALAVRGPGKDTASAGFVCLETMIIGEVLALHQQMLCVLDLRELSDVEGVQVDGLLGHELFKRLVVRIDYLNATVTFMPPNQFEAKADECSLAITFQAHLPTVRASLGGVESAFWLDTGNRNALTLWRQFVDAHPDLIQSQSTPSIVGWGIGGAVQGRFAIGTQFALGPLCFPAPLLSLPDAHEGATATRHVAGNIGGALLRQLLLTFDYSRQCVYLRPNAEFGANFRADCSGMWVNQHATMFLIVAIMPKAPAALAGLQVDDVIRRINETDANTWTLNDFRLLLSEPGAVVNLQLKRGQQTLDSLLTLQQLVAN